LDKTAQSARAALTSSSFNDNSNSFANKSAEPQIDRKEQKRMEAEQRQARSRKKSEIQKRIAALEKEIAELETQQKELTAELEKPETYTGGRAMQINRELLHVHDRLPEVTAAWEAAAMELAKFE
jgi:ATP-binding cassette subfamily F protein 3